MAEIDPVMLAYQVATAQVEAARKQVELRTQQAESTSRALDRLKSALGSFETALSGLSGSEGLRRFSTTFSASDVATATTGSAAKAGTYSFYVEQLATAHQIVFEDLPSVPVASGGPLVVQLADGTAINVNLLAADADGDGSLSQAEIARAINLAEDNAGRIVASIVTVGGQSHLLLSARDTGAASEISLDVSGLPSGALRSAFEGGRELVAAQDAVIWLGGQGGIRVQQASNTFTGIEGVSVTFTRAMTADEPPLTLTVASDAAGTAANVQKFVDAFNTLMGVLDELTRVGNAEEGTPSATLATDAGVRTLRSRLNQIIRQEFGGLSLVDLGIKADRTGRLTLDRDRLEARLESDPDALQTVFGSARTASRSGVLGALDEYLDAWLKSGSGLIAARKASVQSIQKNLAERQARIDAQFDSYYRRYLAQFTELQALQSRMSETSGLFGQVLSG